MTQDWGGSETCVVCGAPMDLSEAHCSLTLSVERKEPADGAGSIAIGTATVEHARELAVCCSRPECLPKLEAALRDALLPHPEVS